MNGPTDEEKNVVIVVVVVVLNVVVLVIIFLLNLSSSSSRSTTMQNLEAIASKLTELWPIWFRSKKGRYTQTDRLATCCEFATGLHIVGSGICALLEMRAETVQKWKSEIQWKG